MLNIPNQKKSFLERVPSILMVYPLAPASFPNEQAYKQMYMYILINQQKNILMKKYIPFAILKFFSSKQYIAHLLQASNYLKGELAEEANL